MLAKRIDEAMDRAVYKIIEDKGTCWGEIPGFQGVWAREAALESCRRERETLRVTGSPFVCAWGFPFPWLPAST